MYIKVKSEQHFAVTGTKRVVVFQASMKLVSKEHVAQISNNDNTQHPKDQNIYEEEEAVNKNDALI